MLFSMKKDGESDSELKNVILDQKPEVLFWNSNFRLTKKINFCPKSLRIVQKHNISPKIQTGNGLPDIDPIGTFDNFPQ